jgi:hypothetical protein
VFVGADDGQEGVGEHGQGDPAGPGGVAADLVFVEAGQSLAGRFPPDVKAVPIPKSGGGTRILGVPTVADRSRKR